MTTDEIMALADAYRIARLPGLNARAALRAAVEQIVRSLSAWEQVWEGIRDNHEPNLNPTNKPLAVAATFQLAISRAERAEADGKAAFDLSVECRARAVKAEAELAKLKDEADQHGRDADEQASLRRKAEAERDALRALLKEARPVLEHEDIHCPHLLAKIDAAL